ncbi:MAG: Bax inhibitor-1/YccA family protein [Fusobacterium ulcerans]|uniref:Bax inhibitor-1/YccA family protein n=1 Tax=Fusobacterium ulcerans TaxID=861 RepID=UPI003A855994
MNEYDLNEMRNEQGVYVNVETTNKFLRKVFLNMVIGVLITTLVPIYYARLLYAIMPYFKIIMFAEIALVFGLSLGINKMSSGTARMMFFLYSLMNGILFSSLGFVFHPVSIFYTLGVALIMFIVIAAYGYTTSEDLSNYGKYLMTGLISIIIMSVINFFLKAPFLYWIGTVLGIVIFSALIAYDVNRIKKIAFQMANGDEEAMNKLGIIGALNLYLDFINLFLYLLRIFGKKRR